jgi:hypothetical protein
MKEINFRSRQLKLTTFEEEMRLLHVASRFKTRPSEIYPHLIQGGRDIQESE